MSFTHVDEGSEVQVVVESHLAPQNKTLRKNLDGITVFQEPTPHDALKGDRSENATSVVDAPQAEDATAQDPAAEAITTYLSTADVFAADAPTGAIPQEVAPNVGALKNTTKAEDMIKLDGPSHGVLDEPSNGALSEPLPETIDTSSDPLEPKLTEARETEIARRQNDEIETNLRMLSKPPQQLEDNLIVDVKHSHSETDGSHQAAAKLGMPPRYLGTPHISGMNGYREMYHESITEPEQFWARMARELLSWQRDFDTIKCGSLAKGNLSWFLEGQLNASYNLVDRHAFKDPDRTAIIYEADEPGQGRTISYGDLLNGVCKAAHILKRMGIKKGDTVAVYMPMIPEAFIAILAVIRLGAVHSVVFAGFSAHSLRDRINNAQSKVIITTDEMTRGGKVIGTKAIVDQALEQCPEATGVLMYKRTGADVPFIAGRDVWWHEEAEKYPPYIAPEIMNAEDPLFLLYTSGSTGKPKGIMHTTAGYLLGAAMSGKYGFDIHDGDKFFCGGDIGWITGHTYGLYAPLLLGVTTVVFEGTPAYPTFSRYWDIIAKHSITHLHIAPTVVRLLKRAGDDFIKTAEMPKLRVLGSVGEPIAAEVWKWYNDVIGKGRAYVCDTYFQTETGSNVITPLAGVTPTKPGSATLPFFGMDPIILDPVSGEEILKSDIEGVLAFKQPWPSMARTVWNAHKRFMDVYLNPYKGHYFTGDRSSRDQDGYYWIRGRADDVVNVSAHRLSTADIEAALIEHPAVAESAVVGVADEITGQAIAAFVAIKDSNSSPDTLRHEFILQVRKSIGAFAAPKIVHIVPDLPKTRSGKIMRRILRKILAGEEDQLGDTTTLLDPSVIIKIISIVHTAQGY